MTIYKIEMMDMDSFNNYMSGFWDYSIKEINIEAETAEEAVAIAKARYPEMVINEGRVKTLEELAAEMGLTIEEYTERNKLAARARRYENVAAKMEAEIKALLEEIELRKRKAAEIKEKPGE